MTYIPTVLKIKACAYLVFHRFLIHRNLSYHAVNFHLHLFGILNAIKIHKSRVAFKTKGSDIQNFLKIQATTKVNTKGQLISKANCQAANSFKKQTNELVFTTMRSVFVRFLNLA